MSSISDSSGFGGAKTCKRCCRMLPITSYYTSASCKGRRVGKCKECWSESYFENKRRPSSEETEDTEEQEPLKRICRPSNLYIMCLSTDPGGFIHGLKIGRSCNIEERARDLASSLPFDMVVLATIPGAGRAEVAVHAHLDARRNTDSNAREWFRISLSEALIAIAVMLPA
jgi:hypothetical protein